MFFKLSLYQLNLYPHRTALKQGRLPPMGCVGDVSGGSSVYYPLDFLPAGSVRGPRQSGA